MDDALPVRGRQGVGQLDGDLQCLVQWHRALLQSFGQRHALEVLRDQVIDALVLADVVQGADVRVVQTGDGLRFTLEPLLEVGV